jgi:penicillin-binding protein 1A
MSKKKSSSKQYNKTLIKIFLYAFLVAVLSFGIFVGICYLGAFGKLPSYAELKKIRNYNASEVYSTDNYLLGRYYLENRTNTDLSEVPQFLINALIATEDARFFLHKGTDTRSTFRVLFKSIMFFNKSSGGGSTITQQLAKNLFPRKAFGILTIPVAKVREILIAKRLEEIYSKKEILSLYLNTVPFGDNTYGVETAALVYFNKQTSQLLPEECATLVAMLKGSSEYNPRINKKAALERRNLVFAQMAHYGYINKSEVASFQKRPLKLNFRNLNHDEGPAPYFREYLRQALKKWADENPKPDGTKYNIYTDGLKIYTTIDYRLQIYAEEATKDQMIMLQKEFDKHWKGHEAWVKNPKLAQNEIAQSDRYKQLTAQGLSKEDILTQFKKPVETKIFTWSGEKELTISPLDSVLHHFGMLQSGLISIEAKTGFIKAWVGGINYKYFKYDHVTSHRQAGSSFKPIVYSAALEKGISPCQFYANDSVVYEAYDNWTPRNANRSYGGYYSVKGAITHSINTVSVKVLMDAGIDNVINFSRRLGFKGDLPQVPSLALGTCTVSLLEMVTAYSIFLNSGREITPVFIRRIEDQKGNVLFTAGPVISNDTFISEKTSEEMNAMLCHVVDSGTAMALRNKYGLTSEIAGKTGTTQDHSDGWFIGYTPDLITAVWVGGDNPVIHFQNLAMGQGAFMALPIFAGYMRRLYADPVFKSAQTSTFHLSEATRESMKCTDYREGEFKSIIEYLEKKKETIGDFVRRIFGRKKDGK